MAKCNFSINFSESADFIIKKAEAAIKDAGGNFSGDIQAGNFGLSTPIGSVNGTYAIIESSINIQIDEKPIFLSCSKIQSELQNYMSS